MDIHAVIKSANYMASGTKMVSHDFMQIWILDLNSSDFYTEIVSSDFYIEIVSSDFYANMYPKFLAAKLLEFLS